MLVFWEGIFLWGFLEWYESDWSMSIYGNNLQMATERNKHRWCDQHTMGSPSSWVSQMAVPGWNSHQRSFREQHAQTKLGFSMCFRHLLANYWGNHLRKIFDFHPCRSFIDFMKLLASETSRYVFVKTKYVWLKPAPFQAIPSVITIKEVWIESNINKHDHGQKKQQQRTLQPRKHLYNHTFTSAP